MGRKLIWIIPAAIVGIVLFCFIGGQLVMYLWNWLLPALFGWRVITFWQALGILALCRILFGRSGWHRAGRSKFRQRMRDRCGRMSPEERERFRVGMHATWGPSGTSSGDKGAPASE